MHCPEKAAGNRCTRLYQSCLKYWSLVLRIALLFLVSFIRELFQLLRGKSKRRLFQMRFELCATFKGGSLLTWISLIQNRVQLYEWMWLRRKVTVLSFNLWIQILLGEWPRCAWCQGHQLHHRPTHRRLPRPQLRPLLPGPGSPREWEGFPWRTRRAWPASGKSWLAARRSGPYGLPRCVWIQVSRGEIAC